MSSVDPFRKLIWDIGNGTSEASLCKSLEGFFHAICPIADVVDKELCKDYKHAYEARCSANSHRLAQEGTFLYVAIVLIFCFSLAGYFKSRKISYIPESAVTIGVGLLTGALFVVSRSNHAFNEQVFFEILLPFIVFEAGYSMDKHLFGQNLGLISLLAILGTFISFGITTGLMMLGNNWLHESMSTLDCAIFGALISSTDPIAIVNVFSTLGVSPRLYTLILGESALNDAVAVALYASMKNFYTSASDNTATAATYVTESFLVVGIGSLILGFVSGAAIALFWKLTGRTLFVQPVLETLCYLSFAVIPYYIADAMHWSGIVSILSASISLSLYGHRNLSHTARLHVWFLVECIARLCEAVMFGYVGTQIVVNNENMVWTPIVLIALIAVLVARGCAVFPIVGMYNCCYNKNSKAYISIPEQTAMWFSGLRGALSFALAITVPEYDSVLQAGSKHQGKILACTCFIIVVNVFIMGTLAPFVLGILLGSNTPSSASEPLIEMALSRSSDSSRNKDGHIGWLQHFHARWLLPVLTCQEAESRVRAEDLLNSPSEVRPDESGFIHVAFADDAARMDNRRYDDAIVFVRPRLAVPNTSQSAQGNQIEINDPMAISNGESEQT